MEDLMIESRSNSSDDVRCVVVSAAVLSFAAALLCIPQRQLDLNEQEIHAASTTTVAQQS